MCGPDTSTRPRGGALVALSPASGCSGSPPGSSTCGDLSFHTPGQPSSSLATHARLTPPKGAAGMNPLRQAVVLIHEYGDLTRTADECGLFRSFAFAQAAVLEDANAIELELDAPVSLEVGGHGIIGRRVTVLAQGKHELHEVSSGADLPVAEGIVGFNFMQAL